MPDYDPSMEALVAELLRVLAPDVEAELLPYVDQLRTVQQALVQQLSAPPPPTSSRAKPAAPLSPEDASLVRMALGVLDAKAGDHELEEAEVLRRLLSAVDRELMKWTSGMVQPIGPSGDAVVAVAETDAG